MTGERTYRVIVRGTFGPLPEETRERLRERLDDHDLLAAPPWSEEGHLVYDGSLAAFSYRVVVRQPADRPDDAAGEAAADRARAALAGLGVQDRPLRANVTSVDDMKIRRR
jgi:hypothetical protein